MSVVLTVKKGDTVWMAADSAASHGDTTSIIRDFEQFKIQSYDCHPGLLVGFCGYLRDINIVQCMDSLFDPNLHNLSTFEFNYKFVVSTIVPNIINELISHGRERRMADGNIDLGLALVIAYEDEVYSIGQDGSVIMNLDDCVSESVGSGATEVISAFRALDRLNLPADKFPIMDLMVRALSIACDYNNSVDYPIIIRNTSSDKIWIYEENDGFYEVDEEGNALPVDQFGMMDESVLSFLEDLEGAIQPEVEEKEDMKCSCGDACACKSQAKTFKTEKEIVEGN